MEDDQIAQQPRTISQWSQPLGQDGKPIYTREYQLDSPDNGGVIIQDHSAGHPYFGGEAASPHFNVRRADNKKNTSVPGIKKHYNYNK